MIWTGRKGAVEATGGGGKSSRRRDAVETVGAVDFGTRTPFPRGNSEEVDVAGRLGRKGTGCTRTRIGSANRAETAFESPCDRSIESARVSASLGWCGCRSPRSIAGI